MYRVVIINNGTQTTIHEPTANKQAPHVLSSNFKESLSLAEQFSCSIPYGNQGYNLVQGLTTKLKVIDTRDNTVTFSGRVLTTQEGMSDGKVTNDVVCEGAMNYLNDSQTRRWHFANQTPQQIIAYLLAQHNLKVDSERQIQVGTIEVTTAITIDTNYETTLNALITKLHNILGGDLRVQERNNVLYLDYLLAQGQNNEVKLEIGKNLRELIKAYDPTDLITRAIPMGYGEGINQLDITSVNNGIEYIEDSTAKAKYGVIEGVVTNKDIQNALTLKTYGQTVLNEKKQPKLTISTKATDRSVLSQYNLEKYNIGDTLHIIAGFMNVNVYARVTERTRDLINSPWNPDLTISTRPITLTNQIIDLKQRSLTLENAPQGNTCIFPLTKAENADASHPITFDLDIPSEAININRVYINLHGRKYRAYEKGLSAAAAQTGTSGSGGGSEQTSSNGGGSTQTSEISSALSQKNVSAWRNFPSYVDDPGAMGQYYIPANDNKVDSFLLGHTHNIDHKHSIIIPDHKHSVTIPDHDHSVTIPSHNHDIEYGIYESTQPKNTKISVNNEDIGVKYGDGSSDFDEYNIDITSKVATGNNKIVISTEQNGRIEATVYCQVFIQSK